MRYAAFPGDLWPMVGASFAPTSAHAFPAYGYPSAIPTTTYPGVCPPGYHWDGYKCVKGHGGGMGIGPPPADFVGQASASYQGYYLGAPPQYTQASSALRGPMRSPDFGWGGLPTGGPPTGSTVTPQYRVQVWNDPTIYGYSSYDQSFASERAARDQVSAIKALPWPTIGAVIVLTKCSPPLYVPRPRGSPSMMIPCNEIGRWHVTSYGKGSPAFWVGG